MSSLAHATPPMTAEEWSHVQRPLKRPYDGPPVLFRSDPKRDPRVTSACADVELEVRNWSARTRHPFLSWVTIQELMAVTKRSRQTVVGHIQRLCDLHRLISLRGVKALKRWLLEHGPRFGLSWEWYTKAVGKRASNRSRFLIVVGRLPPIADGYEWDSIFPLGLKPAEDTPAEVQSPGLVEVQSPGLVEVQFPGLERPPLPISLEERAYRIVVEEPPCGDDKADDESDTSIPDYLRADLSLPAGHPRRKLAERMLRNTRIRADGVQPNPSAGPSLAPLPPAPAPTAAPEAPRARQGDRGRSQAEAIVHKVADRSAAPQDAGMALAVAVGDTKPSTVRTYRAGLSALADGRASLEESLGAVADAFGPKARWPERLLSQALAEFSRRSKRPDAGCTRQSSPASDPKSV